MSKQGRHTKNGKRNSAVFIDPQTASGSQSKPSTVVPEWSTFGTGSVNYNSSRLQEGDVDVEDLLKVMSTIDTGASNKAARRFNIDPIRGVFNDTNTEQHFRKYCVSSVPKSTTAYVYIVLVAILAAVPHFPRWSISAWLILGGVISAVLLERVVCFFFKTSYNVRMLAYAIVTAAIVSFVTMSPIFSPLHYCPADTEACRIIQNDWILGNASNYPTHSELGHESDNSPPDDEGIKMEVSTEESLSRMLQVSLSSQIAVSLISMLPVTFRDTLSAPVTLLCWTFCLGLLGVSTFKSASEFPVVYGICGALCTTTALAAVHGEWNRQIFARIMWWRQKVMRSHKRHVVHLALGQRSRFNEKQKPLSDVQKNSIEAFRKHPTIAPLLIEETKLAIVEEIGRGAMGEVYKALYCDTMVAVKRIPRHMVSAQSLLSFTNEIIIMQSLRHPNIIQLLGVTCNDSNFVAGIFEHMPRGNLRSVLQDVSLTMKWDDPKCKLAIDVARGMAYLHDKQVIHRDLKTDNILVSSTFTCKVADFGTSKFLREMKCSQIGTPFWRAPEMIRSETYTIKADVYSFAIILLEIQLRQNPFDSISQEDSLDLTMRVAQDNWRLPIPPDTPPEIKSLIEDCWNPDAQSRPTFVIILRRLQKYLKSLTLGEEGEPGENLAKLMLDHMIMSGRYVKETYEDGECIIKAGEVGEHCYIVLKGEVSIMRQHKNFMTETPRHTKISKMQLIRVVPTGSYFGEMALLAHAKRVASCFAKGTVTCIKFDREAFLEVYDDEIHGRLAAQVVKLLQSSGTTKESSAQEKKMLETMGSFRTDGGMFSVRNLKKNVVAIEETEEVQDATLDKEKARRATVGCTSERKKERKELVVDTTDFDAVEHSEDSNPVDPSNMESNNPDNLVPSNPSQLDNCDPEHLENSETVLEPPKTKSSGLPNLE